ncbi:MAG TPA: phosphoribosylanthranilate isomerase [Steroidobacteraceae bacterium]|jgi:phosphoribosylanthranilate isomerase
MWIKICGNTSLADAQLAASVGASAVGFIFAPSPRRVTIDQVRTITPHLPRNVDRYGIFVNATFDEIVSTVEQAGLTGVQLHVNDDSDLPRRLRGRFPAQGQAAPFGIIAVLPFSTDLQQQLIAASQDAAVDAILIDSRTAVAYGGTGIRYDWQAAQTPFHSVAPQRRLIVAGGLDPDNVAEAIHTLQPWGVDVVSGVEAAPGRKDSEHVAAFVRNAREAFAELASASRRDRQNA